jgi:protein SCO1/2
MTKLHRLAFVLLLGLSTAPASAFAQALAPARDGPLVPTPTAPSVRFVQRLGAMLPLQAPFVDSHGRTIRLADEFPADGAHPTLLMLGYHRCPQLCGLAMGGVLEAVRAGGQPASAARILFVSVDPHETAADAAARRGVDVAYARFLAGDKAGSPAGHPAAEVPDIERLVGPPASIAALASAVGFEYQSGDAAARFAHPAGLVVVTPDGRVSRYLMGVRFEPVELRTALTEAEAGQVGTLSGRLALLCAHLDVQAGAHTGTVLAGMRVAGVATLALLGLFLWRRRAPLPKEPR